MSPSSPSRRTTLLKSSHTFCETLSSGTFSSISALIAQFFTPSAPKITEHGPEWARSRLPFLSKTWTGAKECEEYFSVLGGVLAIKSMQCPTKEAFIVDVECDEGKGMVSVVGSARFGAVATGEEWDEQFIYRFSGFDEEGRIGHWEIWADPLSAWVAVGEK